MMSATGSSRRLVRDNGGSSREMLSAKVCTGFIIQFKFWRLQRTNSLQASALTGGWRLHSADDVVPAGQWRKLLVHWAVHAGVADCLSALASLVTPT